MQGIWSLAKQIRTVSPLGFDTPVSKLYALDNSLDVLWFPSPWTRWARGSRTGEPCVDIAHTHPSGAKTPGTGKQPPFSAVMVYTAQHEHYFATKLPLRPLDKHCSKFKTRK